MHPGARSPVPGPLAAGGIVVPGGERVREIVGGSDVKVFCLDSTRGSYAYVVVGARTVLVDTCFPGRGPAMWAELQAEHFTPTDIVVTHYDVDHIGSLAWLASQGEPAVWLPDRDVPYILRERPRPGLKRVIGALVKAAAPTQYTAIHDGDQVGDLVAVASPGHTPGHLAYRGPGFMLVGDALSTKNGRVVPTPKLLAWNSAVARDTATRLMSGWQGWILPAHGEPVNITGV